MDIALKEIVMFSQLSDSALAEVEAALKPRNLATGEILFNQGDPGDELIIVKTGQISIFTPTEAKPGDVKPVRVFQAGEMLGEMALIDQKPRSMSARAEQPSTILALNGTDFRKLLNDNPEMAISAMSGLSERIRYTTDFLTEVRKWVQRIAEGSYQTGGLMDEISKYKDNTISVLAAEFAQMAAKVQEREETLRQEVVLLRIEIDETKRKKDAEQIMSSDYYQSLKDKVKSMRENKE